MTGAFLRAWDKSSYIVSAVQKSFTIEAFDRDGRLVHGSRAQLQMARSGLVHIKKIRKSLGVTNEVGATRKGADRGHWAMSSRTRYRIQGT